MLRTIARRVARLEGTGMGSTEEAEARCMAVLQRTSDEDLSLLQDYHHLESSQLTPAHEAALARYTAAYKAQKCT